MLKYPAADAHVVHPCIDEKMEVVKRNPAVSANDDMREKGPRHFDRVQHVGFEWTTVIPRINGHEQKTVDILNQTLEFLHRGFRLNGKPRSYTAMLHLTDKIEVFHAGFDMVDNLPRVGMMYLNHESRGMFYHQVDFKIECRREPVECRHRKTPRWHEEAIHDVDLHIVGERLGLSDQVKKIIFPLCEDGRDHLHRFPL